MNKLTRYLEEVHTEQLANELSSQGYEVIGNQESNLGSDLFATKGEKTIAIQFKAPARMEQVSKHIPTLRDDSNTKGVTDFWLVMVNPPRSKSVDIENLDKILTSYIGKLCVDDVVNFPGKVILGDVCDVWIEELLVKADKIVVEGNSTIKANLIFEGDEEHTPFAYQDIYLPLSFHLVLTHNMDVVVDKSQIERIDTMEFFEG